MPSDGYQVDSDWPEVQKIIKKYKPQIAKEMTREIRGSVKSNIVAPAKRGFAEYSTRIPRAVGSQVAAKGVAVRLSSKRAPHGPINEKGGRHPVFGNRRVWVTQRARPRLEPAVERGKLKVREDISDALIDAARRAGMFRK